MNDISTGRVWLQVAALWLGVFFVVLPAGAAPTGVVVTFDAHHVVASGLVPGTRAVFFGVGLEPTGYESGVGRWSGVVTDAGHAGTLAFDLQRNVPWKSIWVVVDLSNNSYAIACPPGFPVRQVRLQKRLLTKTQSGVAAFLHERSFLDALYVEPGGQAWVVEARDGYDTDGDGRADGVITIGLNALRAVDGTSAKLNAFAPGGLLFVIDFSRMDILAVRLDANLLQGAP